MRADDASDPPVLHGQQILVVGDDALLALLLEDVLLDAGATIIGPVAFDDEALQLIEAAAAQGGLAAAVLDVGLQAEHAQPVADRLAGLGVPFLVTSYDAAEALGQYSAGPPLLKPFDPAKLVAAVHTLLRGG